MSAQELLIPLARTEWYTHNDKPHWAKKARITRAVRTKAGLLARAHLQPVAGPVTVQAHIGYPKGVSKADPHNAAVVKHILDGLTDARIWADDDSTNVPAVSHHRDPSTGVAGLWQVRLVIIPLDERSSPRGTHPHDQA